MDQILQRRRKFVVLFLVDLLRPQHSSHVTQGGGFRVRFSRIALELGRVARLRRREAHQKRCRSRPPNHFSVFFHPTPPSFHEVTRFCPSRFQRYRRNRQPVIECSNRAQL